MHDFMESACRLSLRAAAHSGAGSFLSPVSGPQASIPHLTTSIGALARFQGPWPQKEEPISSYSETAQCKGLG